MQPFLPEPASLCCQQAWLGPEGLSLALAPTASSAACPACGQLSQRVHSQYTRTLVDLPCMGRSVCLELKVRRFFCDCPDCPRRTFAERLPAVAAVRARKTIRLTEALTCIGFALGGQAGARLARALGLSVSGATLLRLVCRAPTPQLPPVEVLGVDDWAWRKGQRYGTILCDLQRHRPVDLLPERSAQRLAQWLSAHPAVRVVARDRGGSYAQGADTGAPQAVQVADRFHLLCNLREAMVRLLDRHPQELAEAARAAAPGPPAPTAQEAPPPPPRTAAQQAQQASRQQRQQRYTQVVELHQAGLSLRQIGRRLGMHRRTVRRFLQAEQFPERAARQYGHRTDPFLDHLRRRWEQGCRNAALLTRELAQQGFAGGYDTVRRCVAGWREPTRAHTPGRKPQPLRPVPPPRPSARRVAWLLQQDAADRSVEQQALVRALCQRCPAIQAATELAQEFHRLLRERRADQLEAWMTRAQAPGAPLELTAFAASLRQDHPAVEAGLRLPWSSGQVEGQINRLKLLKRQMYGRAGFALLRQRVLRAG